MLRATVLHADDQRGDREYAEDDCIGWNGRATAPFARIVFILHRATFSTPTRRETSVRGYVRRMERNEHRPTAKSEHEGIAAGDDAMEDDLTEEHQITPAEREDVAQTLAMDP